LSLKKQERSISMKRFYSSILTVIVAFFVFAPLAVAKPPFWDDQVNSPGRFKVLSEFGGAAVFDKETGLVWEQSPDTNTRSWFNALSHCYTRTVGGRKGWRLPTIEELASLVDPNNPGGNPDLPPDHPFSNVQSSFYWSATTDANNTGLAWGVVFSSGDVLNDAKGNSHFVWCVRGGQGIDGVQ
jgi:hypothetical protein